MALRNSHEKLQWMYGPMQKRDITLDIEANRENITTLFRANKAQGERIAHLEGKCYALHHALLQVAGRCDELERQVKELQK